MTIGSVIVSLAGKKILPKERELLAHPKVGGLVLFRENYDENSPAAKADLMQLIKEIRKINPNLLIMVDHEGGKVWRFNKGFNKLPSAKALGDEFVKLNGGTDTNKVTKEAEEFLKSVSDFGFLMARELLDCGIDLSLAPVVDLHDESPIAMDKGVISKYSRAIHGDPKIVAKIAEYLIRGMNEAGMPAILKHFPGHGSVIDSHTGKPTDNRTLAELESDLIPYKILLSIKDLKLAVMTAHVTYSKVDPNNTAGFSKIWTEDILRKQCGFQGPVMSDCLSMKGADIGTPDIRIIASQAAGCDFQMCTHQKGEDLDILLANLNKIPDNKISEERRQVFANLVQRELEQDNSMTATKEEAAVALRIATRMAKAEISLKAFMAANAAIATAANSAATNIAAPGVFTASSSTAAASPLKNNAPNATTATPTTTSVVASAAPGTAAPMIIKGPQPEKPGNTIVPQGPSSVVNPHKK